MNHLRAFTLIEIVVALGVTIIAVGAITLITIDISDFGVILTSRVASERELELMLRVIISEARSMGPGENGAYPIAQADPQTFTFYGDIDDDDEFERVRYFLDGTTLFKGVIEPTDSEPIEYPPTAESVTEVVHDIVPGVLFTFFSDGYPPEIGPLLPPVPVADIRLIGVSGTVDSDPNSNPGPLTLSIMATVRNLRGEI